MHIKTSFAQKETIHQKLLPKFIDEMEVLVYNYTCKEAKYPRKLSFGGKK